MNSSQSRTLHIFDYNSPYKYSKSINKNQHHHQNQNFINHHLHINKKKSNSKDKKNNLSSSITSKHFNNLSNKKSKNNYISEQQYYPIMLINQIDNIKHKLSMLVSSKSFQVDKVKNKQHNKKYSKKQDKLTQSLHPKSPVYKQKLKNNKKPNCLHCCHQSIILQKSQKVQYKKMQQDYGHDLLFSSQKKPNKKYKSIQKNKNFNSFNLNPYPNYYDQKYNQIKKWKRNKTQTQQQEQNNLQDYMPHKQSCKNKIFKSEMQLQQVNAYFMQQNMNNNIHKRNNNFYPLKSENQNNCKNNYKCHQMIYNNNQEQQMKEIKRKWIKCNRNNNKDKQKSQLMIKSCNNINNCQDNISQQERSKYKNHLKRLQQMNRNLLRDNKLLQSQLKYQSQQKQLILKKIKQTQKQKQKQKQKNQNKCIKQQDKLNNCKKNKNSSKNKSDYSNFLDLQIQCSNNNQKLIKTINNNNKQLQYLQKLSQANNKKFIQIDLQKSIQQDQQNQFKSLLQLRQNQINKNDQVKKQQINNKTKYNSKNSIMTHTPYLESNQKQKYLQKSKSYKYNTNKKDLNQLSNLCDLSKSTCKKQQKIDFIQINDYFSKNLSNQSAITQKIMKDTYKFSQKNQFNTNKNILKPSGYVNLAQTIKNKNNFNSQNNNQTYQTNLNEKRQKRAKNLSNVQLKESIKINKKNSQNQSLFYPYPSFSYQNSINQGKNKNIIIQGGLQCLTRNNSQAKYQDQQQYLTSNQEQESILLDSSCDENQKNIKISRITNNNKNNKIDNNLKDNLYKTENNLFIKRETDKQRLQRLEKYFNELIGFNRLQKDVAKKMQIRKQLADIARQIHHLKNNIIL